MLVAGSHNNIEELTMAVYNLKISFRREKLKSLFGRFSQKELENEYSSSGK